MQKATLFKVMLPSLEHLMSKAEVLRHKPFVYVRNIQTCREFLEELLSQSDIICQVMDLKFSQE